MSSPMAKPWKGDIVRRLLALLTVLVVVFTGSVTVPRSADATVPGAIGRIAFTSDMDEGYGEIYVRDFASGSPVRLTNNTIIDSHPVWSPDGSKIAFRSNRDGKDQVFVMDADGKNPKNVSASPDWDGDPAWSPDGSKIAFRTARDGNAEVYVMNADGTGQTNLTSNTGYDLEPAWSPDGSKIAFLSNRDGNWDIHMMDANGKNPTNVSNSPAWDRDPAWAPDGSRIAFRSDRDGNDEVYVMNVDGSGQTNLTNNAASDSDPAWSPDGSKIAFTSNRDGDYDIYMMDPDGSDVGHLTNNPASEFAVDWESVNRVPVAVGDSVSVVRGGSVTVDVLVNDSDPDGERLSLDALVALPAHGSITNKWVTSFVYQHDGSTATSDSFTYAARDSRFGVSNTATVSVTVVALPPPPPPVAGSDTVGLVDPGSGVWRLRNSVGVVTSFYFGNPGDYPFVGDWDCDGTDTPGLYRQSDGFAYLRNTNTQGNANISFFFGNPGDVPIAGDFNNDGCDTLSIYRPSNQRFYIINALGQDGGGLGAADYEFLFGNPGDTPVVGDWDGDGTDEIGLYRESSGFFYYRNTLTTGIADGQFYFGNPGDRFVAGDWGVVDGKETPGLFRPAGVTFYFRHTMTQGNADSQFTWTGADTDSIPVAGDFNLS